MSAYVPPPTPPPTPPPISTLISPPLPAAGSVSITGPLSVTNLLDRIFRALRARFGILILSAAIIYIPLGIVAALISGRFVTGYAELFRYSLTDPQAAEVAAERVAGNSLGYFGVTTLLTILSFVGASLVFLMCMHHIQQFLHGEPSTLKGAWQAAIRRLLPMLGMQFVEYLVIGIVTMVVLVAVFFVFAIAAVAIGVGAGGIGTFGNDTTNLILGIGVVIVMMVAYLLMIIVVFLPAAMFMGRWLVAAPSLLIEELGPIQALQRSWALTKGRFWRSLLFIVLIVILLFVLLGLPATLFQFAIGILAFSGFSIFTIVSTFIGYAMNLIYQPLLAAAVVLYYYDLRVRAEAYDVALRVAALEAEVAPDATPA